MWCRYLPSSQTRDSCSYLRWITLIIVSFLYILTYSVKREYNVCFTTFIFVWQAIALRPSFESQLQKWELIARIKCKHNIIIISIFIKLHFHVGCHIHICLIFSTHIFYQLCDQNSYIFSPLAHSSWVGQNIVLIFNFQVKITLIKKKKKDYYKHTPKLVWISLPLATQA